MIESLGFGKKKIYLIMLKGKTLDIKKAKWDKEKNLATCGKHKYIVNEEHLFFKKGKIYCFIDLNARKSISDEKLKGEDEGKSIKPELEKDLDVKLMNKLDYLSEASFWESLNLRKRDIVELLLSMGCGIGLYSIFRVILSMYGYYLP